MERLRGPRTKDKETDVARYGYWEGYRQVGSLVAGPWSQLDYRVTAGCIRRVADARGTAPWAEIVRPLRLADVPAEAQQQLAAANLFDPVFEGAARVAWAWAPRPFW